MRRFVEFAMSAVLNISDTITPAGAAVDAVRQGRKRRLDSMIDDARLTRRAVGQSAAWRDVLRKAIQVAATETPTCLQGESGTGKEVIARLIHSASPRRNGPFVAINHAALPDQLLESELFGFERGAFTGAQQAK